MPLLKGEKNIGHNIREMEEHGHPHKQAVAAALSTAYDDLNTESKRQAQREGTIMSHDEPYARPVTSMTQSDLNEANKKYWGGEAGNIGPAETEAKAPMLAGTKVVPVYRGAGDQDEKFGDEVSPTQSDPPDSRSNNLLGTPAVAGKGHDDMVEGSEAMEANDDLEEVNKAHENTQSTIKKRNEELNSLSNPNSEVSKQGKLSKRAERVLETHYSRRFE
jgi:hypothetical protein